MSKSWMHQWLQRDDEDIVYQADPERMTLCDICEVNLLVADNEHFQVVSGERCWVCDTCSGEIRDQAEELYTAFCEEQVQRRIPCEMCHGAEVSCELASQCNLNGAAFYVCEACKDYIHTHATPGVDTLTWGTIYLYPLEVPPPDQRPVVQRHKEDAIVTHFTGAPQSPGDTSGPPWRCRTSAWERTATGWQCECPHFIYRDTDE